MMAPVDGSAPDAGNPSPAPAPAPAPAADWTSSLDADLRGVVTTKGWKDPGEVIKSYANLERTLGADKVAIPGKDAKPEDWAAVYNKLGRPESPEKYDLSTFKPPEGLPWNGDVQKSMVSVMHAAGLNNTQVNTLLSEYAKAQGAQFTEYGKTIGQSVEAGIVALKKDWGAAYDAKLDVANRAFKHFLGSDMEAASKIKLADGTNLFDNPIMARAFSKVGESIGEDTLKGGNTGVRLTMDPAEAKAEIGRLEGDPKIMAILNDKQHPEYGAMNAKRAGLYALAYPEPRT